MQLNTQKAELEKENKILSKHQQGINEEEKTTRSQKQETLKALREEAQNLALQVVILIQLD